MSSAFERTEQNEVKRAPSRGTYEHQTVFDVIDNAWIGHIGIANSASGVTVIPMLHARMEDTLIFHGANSSRLMKHLASGERVCVSFALVDGLVLAKSLFHHSMNYRSAVVFGRGELLEEPSEIENALRAISDKIMPDRWNDARKPNEKELAATAVVRVTIESGSAKIRAGGPIDDADDVALPVWSGVLPIHSRMEPPIANGKSATFNLPQYIERFRTRFNPEQD